MRRQAELVTYVSAGGDKGGDGERKPRVEHAALVTHDDGGGTLDLIVLTESGNDIQKNVPRRDPSDYGDEGGGRTWH